MTYRTHTLKRDITGVLEKAREQKLFPGCVVGIIRVDATLILPFGSHTYDVTSPAVTADTVYDVASITKAIPTTSLALYFLDQKKLSLDTQVIQYIPELSMKGRERILVRHLLTYTLDVALTLSHQKEKKPAEILRVIFSADLKSPLGTKHIFANATSILLGLLIERVGKKPLDVLAAEIFFDPLNMKRTTFHPKVHEIGEIAPTEINKWRGLVHGVVHDEGTYALSRPVGAAGLFSTTGDLLLFLQVLLHNGMDKARRFFSDEIVSQMATNQLKDIGECAGLGWELNQRRYIGKYTSEKTISKTGFTGCCVIADLEKKLGLVLLSNYTYPKRKQDYKSLNVLRSALADIVFARV